MSDLSVQSNSVNSTARIDPQRLAWGALLIAFAIFCVICIISGIGVNYFLFQSSVPMETRLVIGRGTVGLVESDSQESEQAERIQRSLSDTRNVTIKTDTQSQGTLSFEDRNADLFLASVTLKNNTALNLRTASRPRFDWSSTPYYIELSDVLGEFDVFVAENLRREFVLSVRTPSGALVNLIESGQYIIDVSETSVRVFTRSGNAVLIPANYESPRLISSGEQGSLTLENQQILVSPAYTELLANSHFRDMTDEVNEGDTQQLLKGWVCANDPNDEPPGSYRTQMKDGRMALRLLRADNAQSHGRTSCIQSFGQSGLDINPDLYDYLALRSTFYVEYQSLNACGVDGSECPLMLRMDYRRGDRVYQWFHGFYAAPLTPEQNYPLRCSSCAQDHEAVNEKSWYTYDSGNLFAVFPPDQRPDSIVGVWVYASGHQYDVYVSELSLLAGRIGEAPPMQNVEAGVEMGDS